jgi:Sec7-like guanine-nucleotide exchange factor
MAIDKFQRTRLQKNEMIKASIKFNLKPKNGIAYLVQKGFIPKDPQDLHIKGIVEFLKSTGSLDKTKIGEYLGEDIDLNKQVLYQYVDSFDFNGVPYVESLKRLLSGFRLPGEGQKVDRIMEKFGEKYCKDNHDAFGNAECIYLLSYATMMLQTSIHNPQAQK